MARIVIGELSGGNRLRLKYLLELEEHEVVGEAVASEQLRDEVRDQRPDLVISNVMLVGEPLVNILKRMRLQEGAPQPKVILYSRTGVGMEEEKELRAVCDAFVRQSVANSDRDVFIPTIHKVLSPAA